MSITRTANTTTQDLATAPASLSITKPTGSADIYTATFGCDRNGAGAAAGTYTAPSGWSPIFTAAVNTVTGGRSVALCGYWALAATTNLTFTKSGTIDDVGVIVAGWLNVDTTNPIDANSAVASNQGAATLATNSVTIVTNGALPVVFAADWLGKTLAIASYTAAQNASANASAAVLYAGATNNAGDVVSATLTDGGTSTGQTLLAAMFAFRPAASAFTWQQTDQYPGLYVPKRTVVAY